MAKKFYHATPFSNLASILESGLKPGCDGIVYLAETLIDAASFLWIRTYEDILVIEVELDENEVEEQFDHNPYFFKCKAFGYPKVITTEQMTDFRKFEKRLK